MLETSSHLAIVVPLVQTYAEPNEGRAEKKKNREPTMSLHTFIQMLLKANTTHGPGCVSFRALFRIRRSRVSRSAPYELLFSSHRRRRTFGPI